MSILRWLLIGFAAYWIAVMVLNRAGFFPSGVQTQGPIITIHTVRGRVFLERLAAPRRLWRAWGNLGVGIALVIMVGMFLAVVNAAIGAVFAPEPTAITEPRNVLVIPGVNEFLPLSATPEIVAGLLIGLVVHEGGHGLLCRVEEIDIESMGVALIAFVPIGAFVQPDEESQLRADRGGQSRMFAAGVMNNFAVTVLAFILLFWLVGGFVTPAAGAAVGTVLPGSAAADAGIETGDRIVEIDGTTIPNASTLETYLAEEDAESVSVSLSSGEALDVQRSLLVVAAVPGGPAGLNNGDVIETIEGESMHTEAGMLGLLAEQDVVTVTTAAGDERTFPAGAYVAQVVSDGPFAAAGAPTDDDATLVITAINDERVASMRDAQAILAETQPGQRVSVEAYLLEAGESISPDASPETYDVELGAHDAGHGFLGVSMQPGVTGISVNDFGTQFYPTERFLATLGGETDEPSLFGLETFFGKVFSAMVLPIAALLGAGIDQNFAGFTGHVAEFYQVTGPLAGAEGVVFVVANVLFWAGWINFNLGIFNCIPAFPLDGGHLLRASAESVVSRLPLNNRYVAVKYVTVSIGLMMLMGLMLMVFGQGLLS